MKQDLISKAVYVCDVGNVIEGFFFFLNTYFQVPWFEIGLPQVLSIQAWKHHRKSGFTVEMS